MKMRQGIVERLTFRVRQIQDRTDLVLLRYGLQRVAKKICKRRLVERATNEMAFNPST
jgi:hypothetical protein